MFGPPARRPQWPALLAVGVAFLIVGVILGGHPSWLPGFVRDTFVSEESAKVATDPQARSLQQGLQIIHDNYYREVPEDDIVDSGLAAAVRGLHDQFSNYFDRKTYAAFNQRSDPHFTGIGVTVAQDRRGLRITDVFDGSPAQDADLRAGDVIIEAAGKSLRGKPTAYSSGLIRGRPGTTVPLEWLRGAKRIDKRVERKRIVQPVVAGRILRSHGRKLAYVQLTTFSQGAGDQVKVQVRELLKRGATGVIFDLRHNGGGLLEEAVDTASAFIGDGVIVSTDGRARDRKTYQAVGGAISDKVPVVVLVDRGTASSSEIVAGAIQDRGRGKLVGTRTFGKGVFQEIRPLPNGGALDVTVGEYFLPSGRNLGGGGVKEGKGLKPNVAVSDNPKTPKRDEALEAAERLELTELPG